MPKLLSLCTGYGGLDLAIDSVLSDVELVAMSEFDPKVALVAEQRFSGVTNYGDLTRIDWRYLEHVDILTAGYPCQPFSLAGKRQGANDDRHIWPYIAEGIRTLQPGLVVLENVSGHRSSGFGTVLGDLAAAGYDACWASVRASDVGAPHRRERVFIVATSPDSYRQRWAGRSEHNAQASQEDFAAHRDVSFQRWGTYIPAIQRWERVVGRAVPPALTPTGAHNPVLVEWMMGLPAGWVTDVLKPNGKPLGKTDQLHILGNGVVPQQAAHALRLLLNLD